MRLKKQIIGQVSVDSGLLWVGDPCYILHTQDGVDEKLGKNWSHFCDILGNRRIADFDGTGVAVGTVQGDGFYDVVGSFDEKGICHKIEINLKLY